MQIPAYFFFIYRCGMAAHNNKLTMGMNICGAAIPTHLIDFFCLVLPSFVLGVKSILHAPGC